MHLSNNWCRACKRAPETPHHVLFSCSRFEALRWNHLAQQDFIYDDPDRGPLIRGANDDDWILAEKEMTPDVLDLILSFIGTWNSIFSK